MGIALCDVTKGWDPKLCVQVDIFCKGEQLQKVKDEFSPISGEFLDRLGTHIIAGRHFSIAVLHNKGPLRQRLGLYQV